MIGLGLLTVFQRNLGGLWLAVIGWFLFMAAAASDQDVMLRLLLKDVKARDLMSPNLVTIRSNATISEAIDQFSCVMTSRCSRWLVRKRPVCSR